MKLKKLTPMLMVQDVHSSIEFYQTFLNFELVQAIPDTEPFEWASMKCGRVEIELQDQANMAFDIPEMQGIATGSTILFYVQVDDIQALYAQVKDQVEISQDIWTFYPDICEFRIRDPNGYFWTFVEKAGKTEKKDG